jgi:cell division protein FtsW
MIRNSRTNRSFLFEWWRSVDRLTLGMLVALIISGLILSMAASPAAANRLSLNNPFHFLYRHSLFAVVGLFGAVIVSMMNTALARRLGVLALLGSAIMLAILLSNRLLSCLRPGCSRCEGKALNFRALPSCSPSMASWFSF